jgi:hypothetical protein
MKNIPQRIQSAKLGERDLENPDFKGWLDKQSLWLKQWRRRYFILKGKMLYYCVNEKSAPHGEIDLSEAGECMILFNFKPLCPTPKEKNTNNQAPPSQKKRTNKHVFILIFIYSFF